ncbi:MAG: DUF116 domain-containing protein [Candidatus Micrarchaeota archaeon]
MDLILLLGQITLAVLVLVLAFTVTAAALILYSIKTGRAIFPRFQNALISALGGPIKSMFNFFRLDSDNITKIEIQVKNKISKQDFAKTEYGGRLLALPQCLRHKTKCPATLTEDGIQCKGCGQCVVKQLKEEAEKLGYTVIVAPGGTLVKRLIKKHRPKAVLGVGCIFELQEGLSACAQYGIPAQGVQLLRDGCVSTEVDLSELNEIMHLKS